MRIEEELKLDYSDVLFRPKRSTLSSRKDVDLNRTYKFKYSRNEWSGIPIMAANMDGVGELGIADALSANEMITCLPKQHDVKKLSKYKNLILKLETELANITSADNIEEVNIENSILKSEINQIKEKNLNFEKELNKLKSTIENKDLEIEKKDKELEELIYLKDLQHHG